MKNVLFLFLCLIQFPSQSQQPLQENIVYICTPCNSRCDDLEFSSPGNCPHCGMQLIKKEEAQNHESSKNMKIAFYLQDGVEVLDFAGPMEVFSYAGYEVFTVSKTKDPIKTQGIMTIQPDYSIKEAPQADVLAFFGGNTHPSVNDPELMSWIKDQNNTDYYFSVCTGAFILAESGMLRGKTATTFHNALDGLEKKYPETKVLKNVRFVDNGNVITTAGISAGIDGALHLVAKLQGFNAARKIAYHMEYDKWTPGEGLILSNDDPYEEIANISYLQDYVGTYDFKDGSQIQLKIDEREKSLYAVVHEMNYPLFFIEKDKFIDETDEAVIFERGHNDNVIGYTLSNDSNKIYRKIE